MDSGPKGVQLPFQETSKRLRSSMDLSFLKEYAERREGGKRGSLRFRKFEEAKSASKFNENGKYRMKGIRDGIVRRCTLFA